MARLSIFIVLSVLLVAVYAGPAYNSLKESIHKRAMDLKLNIRAPLRMKRGCLGLGAECRGDFVNNCCDETQCYWENGFSLRKKGVCVTCVQEGQKCQRDSNCCSGMECKKGNFLWVDGNCEYD